MAGERERVNVYLGVVARLEPDLTAIDRDDALASIAVSLKRIADYMQPPNVGTVVKIARKTRSDKWPA